MQVTLVTILNLLPREEKSKFLEYCIKGEISINLACRILEEIGAKRRIMELMTHEDQEVRYQALLAVQKYMHQTW